MKVTMIGGGSYQWGPNLIADMLQTESLAGMHLVLEDIDAEPLACRERPGQEPLNRVRDDAFHPGDSPPTGHACSSKSIDIAVIGFFESGSRRKCVFVCCGRCETLHSAFTTI